MRMPFRVAGSLLLLGASAAAGASSDRTFERVVAAQPHGVVDISNVAGSIEVSGWDRQEVSVRAELETGVEHVDVSSDGGRTTIKVVLPHSASHGEAELHVQIPKDSELDVSAVSADIKVSGVLGVQRLNAVSGDVTAEIAGSDVDAKTVSGEVRLKGHGQAARLHVSSVSGDLRLEHGAGDLEAGTVSGTMVVSLDSARSVRTRSTSGDLRFEGKLTHGATFDASTVSGDSERARQCRWRLCLRSLQLQRRHQRLLRRQSRAQRPVRPWQQAAGHARGGGRAHAPEDHER